MVYNSNIPLECIISNSNFVKCAAKHIDDDSPHELYFAKEKNPESNFDYIEHVSIEQILADPPTKGLPPSV